MVGDGLSVVGKSWVSVVEYPDFRLSGRKLLGDGPSESKRLYLFLSLWVCECLALRFERREGVGHLYVFVFEPGSSYRVLSRRLTRREGEKRAQRVIRRGAEKEEKFGLKVNLRAQCS